MDMYYNLRNIFLLIFAVFALLGIFYGVKVHIITILQKYFGIEERREIAKMRKDKDGTVAPRSPVVPSLRMTGPRLDYSHVKTEDLITRGTDVLREEQDTVVLGDTQETVVLGNAQETVVLGNTQETVVLGNAQETVVLAESMLEELPVEPEAQVQPEVRKNKDVVLTHGEDIF